MAIVALLVFSHGTHPDARAKALAMVGLEQQQTVGGWRKLGWEQRNTLTPNSNAPAMTYTAHKAARAHVL